MAQLPELPSDFYLTEYVYPGDGEQGGEHGLAIDYVALDATVALNGSKHELPETVPQCSLTWSTRNPEGGTPALRVFNAMRRAQAAAVDEFSLDFTISSRGYVAEARGTVAAAALREIDHEQSGSVRVDTQEIQMLWTAGQVEGVSTLMVVSDSVPTDPWLTSLVEETATPRAQDLLLPNLGALAAHFDAFAAEPYGTPALEDGFTIDIH